ncbi:MAG: RNA helicase, partial [Leptolyngbyaceae bacterium]|nr:RNA helicase [Leptolyngbyaceae bacterium]
QQGLIKVVFATETLAAGINMPARTTVISTLSKRTDRGHRLLNASEFLQMSGRAGRRGMDPVGHVVTLQTNFEGAKEAAYLATASADPLVSQFTPSYGMVLNLLQTHTLEEAQELVERSFGQYLANLSLQPQQQAIADLEIELAHQQARLAEVDTRLLANYEKLQERLREERRLLKTLQHQAEEVQASDMAIALRFAVTGTILSIKGEHVRVSDPLPAVLVAKTPGSGQFPYLICLGQDNRWYVATVADVVGLHGEYPRIAEVDHLSGPPAEMPLKPGQHRSGTEETAAIADQIPQLQTALYDPDLEAQVQRVAALEAQLQTHPAQQWGNPGSLLKQRQRAIALQDKLEQAQSQLGRLSHRHWEEFLNLITILQNFNCLEEIREEVPLTADRNLLRPTVLGQAAAAIRGDNELWLGIVLMSGLLDHLDPHHLAAVCAALVTEASRPDSWTRYNLSSEVDSILEELWSWEPRRRLIKMQRQYQVVLPVWLEDKLVAIVEQWALGMDWVDLCAGTSLDEGDVVRLLRRTLDFLSQIPHVPYAPEAIRRNASRAIQLMDRFPVNETVE